MNRLNYYNPNTRFDRKALTEVWEILNEYEEGIDKIPEKYLWVIEDNMDKDYIFVIDDFDTTVLRKDTKKIITYLYTNFLSTPEEKNVLKKLEEIQYKEKLEKENNKSQEAEVKYSVFNRQNLEEKVEAEQEQAEENRNNLPIEYKESVLTSILIRIKEFIKNIFKR